MKANRFPWAIVLLLGVRGVRGDIFDQVATNGQTNKLSATNVVAVQDNSIEALIAKAKLGDVEAEAMLGWDYLFGAGGVAKDIQRGVEWTHKAAEHGDVISQHNLGYIYGNGLGVAKNSAEAFLWYQKAAAQGFGGAEFEVGAYYYSGDGAPQDYAEAVKWLRKSAEQGYSRAQNNLGVCYENGEGVPIDYVQAYKWFNLALAQGLETARTNLALVERIMTVQQIAEAQTMSSEFTPRKEEPANSSPNGDVVISGTGFFITDDGYLISNYHVVKDADKSV